MAKPTQTAEWARDQSGGGGTHVTTEPTETKKDLGWENTEKPRAGYMNWWKNLVGLWTKYVDELEAEDLTWTGAHVFVEEVVMQDGATVIGDIAVSGDVAAGSLTTAQTSVQRAAGWMNVGISSFKSTGVNDIQHDSVFHRLEIPAATGADVTCMTAPLPLLVVGDRIRDIELTATCGDVGDACKLYLRRINLATGVITDLVVAAVASLTLDTVVSADIAHVVADGYEYYLDLAMEAATDGANVYGVRIRTDRIA